MDRTQPERIVSSDTKRLIRIPPGQHEVKEWPILHEGRVQKVDLASWEFKVFGMAENELIWSWEEFRALPSTDVLADWHCVTTWTMLDMLWTGVTAREVMEHLEVLPGAKAVMVHAQGGYKTNLLMTDFLEEDVVFAWAESGEDLSPERGGPLRLIVPKLYAWKSAKWVTGIELMGKDRPGFWEQRGYHMRGDPWNEERR